MYEEGRAEIAQLREYYIAAFNAGDSGALGALFVENAQEAHAYSPFRVVGRAAIVAGYEMFFKVRPDHTLLFDNVETRFFNDGATAIETGEDRLIVRNPGGSFDQHYGRFSVTLVKVEGRWLIADLHASAPPRFE